MSKDVRLFFRTQILGEKQTEKFDPLLFIFSSKKKVNGFVLSTKPKPQNNAVFQSIINDVISSIIMI